ncbi:MAG: septum formation initiator family protein [Altererythrobacter sp.]
MRKMRHQPRIASESMTQGIALAVLLLLGALALVGPSGILAWGETQRLLDQRQDELAMLEDQRDRLRNRVDLLDPRNVDPDLGGELLRDRLNVAHPDEMIILID